MPAAGSNGRERSAGACSSGGDRRGCVSTPFGARAGSGSLRRFGAPSTSVGSIQFESEGAAASVADGPGGSDGALDVADVVGTSSDEHAIATSPAIFLAQFAGDGAPFNSLPSIAKWAASLGYKGIQIPTWDGRLFDLEQAATAGGRAPFLSERVAGLCFIGAPFGRASCGFD